jgi:hypothetical protein
MYVKLWVTSGKGAWQSEVFREKVNVGLPVDLILGMSFLASHHIIIDTQLRSACDKRVDYDLIRPKQPLSSHSCHPTHKAKSTPEAGTQAIDKGSEPPLAGYLRPAPIMAAVREHIESLAFQDKLAKCDTKFKVTFSNCFPLQLPAAMNIPTHLPQDLSQGPF